MIVTFELYYTLLLTSPREKNSCVKKAEAKTLPQLLGGFENMKNSACKGDWRRGKQPFYES